jgi:pimeloyl-ACP methyl ester carboxylesterase
MAATNNPLEGTTSSPSISQRTITIAGIHVVIHGLSELPPSCTSVTCLWLLNPRLQTKETMAPVAASIISGWNSTQPKSHGLIAAAFDQRNHGSRLVDKLHNEAWRQGNETHAQDMFGCYHGTAVDCSQLIDHLGSYIFTSNTSSFSSSSSSSDKPTPTITSHFALGISLGGHAVWHTLLSDPRITAGIVGIGCPDYTRLLTDRARLSKRSSYTSSTPPGAAFLGSTDFPLALMQAVEKFDPAGLLLPGSFNPVGSDPSPSPETLERFRALVRERLQGKRILNLSGREDKLVPYAAGKPFLDVFKRVLDEDQALDVGFEDVLFDGVGHAFPPAMVEKATAWICDLLAKEERGGQGERRGSKI